MAYDDKDNQPLEQPSGQPPPASPTEPEEEQPVPFVDKFIAFVILAIPFSALLVYVQDLLIERYTKSVTNMVLLVGIIMFLLSIGRVAKRIHAYRTK